ncbi:MAG: hypothetical protein ACXWWC_10570 [Chitinophagaceae bacterium]
MKNVLINNRIFAIVLTATLTTAFYTPAIANDQKDALSAEIESSKSGISDQFSIYTDQINYTNSRFAISGKKNNNRVVYLDLSWYRPQPPEDINPYDNIQLDFSWYSPAQPLDINPYSE